MHLHQGIYLGFCNSSEIYNFTLDLFPTVPSMDDISYFLHCPTRYAVTGPSGNRWGGMWHHEPRVQTDMGWEDPTNIDPEVLQELGTRQVSILWPPNSGCLLILNGQPRFCLNGKKKKQGLGEKRCLPWWGAAHGGINDACGSLSHWPWEDSSEPAKHWLIKPVTNGQEVYWACTAVRDPINQQGCVETRAVC